MQPLEATILKINSTPVKNVQELQAALDPLAAGSKVAIAYKSKGKDMLIEGVVM